MIREDDLIFLFDHYKSHPVDFVRQMFNVDPHPHQAEVMQAVADGNRRVSVRSGRRVGKTAMMAWLAVWFEMTRADAKTIVTAPSAAQLADAFVPELRKWLQRLPDGFRDLWDSTAEKFHFRMSPNQGYESFISVRTSRQDSPESMQGINAPNVLVLPDEAAGVPDVVMEALSGSMGSDGSYMVLTGNPNRDAGFFYATHTTMKEHWYTVHVNSEDVPTVSREWIREMEQKYGRNSNQFRVHVLGEFPTAADQNVIPRELVETAVGREVDVTPNEPMIWGLDVARFGEDESVLAKRQGNTVSPLVTWRNLDTQQLAMRIHAEYEQTHRKPSWIMVDSIGLGAGVVDRLRELDLPVRGINVSENPALSDHYRALKDELWDKCRAWLERRDVRLPKDPILVEQLATVRKDFTPSGKLKVESKKDLRRRGESSPDRADALVLTFAATAGKALYGTARSRRKKMKRRIPGLP